MQPELRVFILERCLINPVPVETRTIKSPFASAALAALFLPKIIELAIGSVATLLKKAGADKTEHAAGRAFTNLFVAGNDQALRANSENGCLLGVYGIFSDEDGEPTHPDDKALLALEHAGLVPKNADIQGHPLLVQLGELLDGAKKDAAAEISKLILPEDRAKAEAERAAAAEKLYDDELQAEFEVRTAQKAYDDDKGENKPTLRVKLEQAIRKRDRATRLRKAAGLPDRPAVPDN